MLVFEQFSGSLVIVVTGIIKIQQRMKHLIIYAHPSGKSFSNKLCQKLQDEGDERGWETTVRDLYKMKWDPVLWPEDLENLSKGITNDLVKKEQNLLLEADVISVIYPLWWAGFPAILKGYIDKVLAYGFAYKATEKGIEGLLNGKKVYLFTSMGNSVEQYEEKGLIDAFKQIQGHEVFSFCGMEVQNHLFFPQIPSASNDQIQLHLGKALTAFFATNESLVSNG